MALWVAYFVRFDTLSFLSDINKNELKNQYEAIKQLLCHLFYCFCCLQIMFNSPFKVNSLVPDKDRHIGDAFADANFIKICLVWV